MFKRFGFMFWEAPSEMAGGGDVSQEPVTPEPQDTSAGSEPAPEPILEYNGKQYTESELLSAIEAHQTKSDWEQKLQGRSQELNAIANALEAYRSGGQSQPNNLNAQPQGTEQQMNWNQFANMLLDNPDQAGQIVEQYLQQYANQVIENKYQEQEVKGKFLGEYKDYEQITNSPEFQQFASQRPWMGTVNNYFAYKLQSAVPEARQAGAQETLANLKAKGQIRVLTGQGQAPVPQGPDVKSMDQNEFLNHTTAMIEKMRQSQG